jgi:hypothetical protein
MPEIVLTGEDARFRSQQAEPSPSAAEIFSIDIRTENIFNFLDNAYYGTGGFRSGDYLIPHKRELWYDTRKKISYYVNFIKPIIRAMVEPVFIKPAVRVFDDEMLSGFIDDVDNRGTDIQRFTYMATNICRRHSIVFVVVDNFVEQPIDQKTAIDDRVMPYCYTRRANHLYGYKLDSFGNVNEMVFLECPAVYTNGTITEKTKYRRWTKTYTQIEVCENEYAGATGSGKFIAVPGTYREHNLGVVPVIVMRDIEIEQAQDFIPTPRMYDIARVNHAIFNKDSEVREIERNQAFAVFCVNQNKASNLSIGTNNVLFYPVGSNAPQFVAPPMDVLSQLIADRKELRDDLFRLAEQNGVVAIQDAKSGIALAYEFFAHESILQQTAKIAESIEEKIAILFGLWVGRDIDYQVNYKSTFVPHSEENRLKLLDAVSLQTIPIEFRKKIVIDEYKILFPDSGLDEIKIIENAYDAEATIKREQTAQ